LNRLHNRRRGEAEAPGISWLASSVEPDSDGIDT
jgi:hypothetical protein